MSESQPRICTRENSVLLVVDIQERLAAAMDKEERARVIRNTGILLEAARLLEIPRIVTEQYPKGLGPTESELAERLGDSAVHLEKSTFSCCGADGFGNALSSLARRQIVIAGMEAHVCVLQTALGLRADGFEVYVAGDAVCSRRAANRDNALDRLQQAGIVVANTESIAFEWLADSANPHFRAIAKLVR